MPHTKTIKCLNLPPKAVKHRRLLDIPLPAATRQRRRAVHEPLIHTNHAHLLHGWHKRNVPHSLAERKAAPSNRSHQILSQILVRLEGKGRAAIQGLTVETVIPDSHGGVQRGTGARGVSDALLGRRMGADEGNKVDDGEAFGSEEFDEVVGAGVSSGKNALGVGRGIIFASDLNRNGGATGACFDGMC